MAIPARHLTPEFLDALEPEDPRAQRSRRDLQRLHRVLGTAAILRRGLLEAGTGSVPPRLIELGAGDGTLLLAVLRSLGTQARGGGEIRLLDRVDAVGIATRRAYARLGWRLVVECRDVLEWARQALLQAPQARRDELCVATLFLHHLDAPQLRLVLAAIAARTRGLIALEPRRSRFARFGSRLVALLGASAVTRADAITSVDAGFAARELSDLWPRNGVTAWRLHEGAAGPFLHRFSVLSCEAVEPRADAARD